MRRAATVLAALLWLLAGAVPPPASAATGLLLLNGDAYDNPPSHRCIVHDGAPLTVENRLDTAVIVWSTTDCTGTDNWVVARDQVFTLPNGRAVYTWYDRS
ncbi:hypothetical protein [Saccharothrix sp. ST-888]|uniref:hypothetical protein n=1 Tax=Saccharothrix sp. ST-888 TaxID=1427391 RepID=UPI0005EBF5C0|nr:hypothetical protein [Saccharothrix sp. ST-888]KJK57828.1 hypothetical protein UK12_13995 [Saccharothrix sp. ST-888]